MDEKGGDEVRKITSARRAKARVWQSENHVGCGNKRVKQKREVSEWEKENLIVFLAMEQR